MQDFRNLGVWQKAHELTLKLYGQSEQCPRTEMFGLAHQLRRTGMLLPMKTAEVCGQDRPEDFRRCVQQARAMGNELEYQLLLARDLNLIKSEAHDALAAQVVEVRKMLSGLLRAAVWYPLR